MDSMEKVSDKLLQEIIQLEVEIDKLMALNGNHEDPVVKHYRKFILARRKRLNKINFNHKG